MSGLAERDTSGLLDSCDGRVDDWDDGAGASGALRAFLLLSKRLHKVSEGKYALQQTDVVNRFDRPCGEWRSRHAQKCFGITPEPRRRRRERETVGGAVDRKALNGSGCR